MVVGVPMLTFRTPSFDVTFPILQRLPEFLRSTSYRNPDGNPQSPAQSVFGYDWFEYLYRNPEQGQVFDSAMSIHERLPAVTTPTFPYKDQALAASHETKEPAVLVDVGGGRGQFVEKLLEDVPDIPCVFIVQDLEPVIAGVEFTSPKIRGMVQDFFEPQAVKGGYPCIRFLLFAESLWLFVDQY